MEVHRPGLHQELVFLAGLQHMAVGQHRSQWTSRPTEGYRWLRVPSWQLGGPDPSWSNPHGIWPPHSVEWCHFPFRRSPWWVHAHHLPTVVTASAPTAPLAAPRLPPLISAQLLVLPEDSGWWPGQPTTGWGELSDVDQKYPKPLVKQRVGLRETAWVLEVYPTFWKFQGLEKGEHLMFEQWWKPQRAWLGYTICFCCH